MSHIQGVLSKMENLNLDDDGFSDEMDGSDVDNDSDT